MTCSEPVRALGGMGRAVSASDSDLLASTVAGDADAFATFYRRHVGAVTGFAVRLGATSDDVADIVSETFIVALTRAGRFVPVSGTAQPWLLGSRGGPRRGGPGQGVGRRRLAANGSLAQRTDG